MLQVREMSLRGKRLVYFLSSQLSSLSQWVSVWLKSDIHADEDGDGDGDTGMLL